MTYSKHFALAAALGAVVALQSAQATLITLNSGGSPQPANSGQGTIEAWIAGLVTTYNAANNPDLPAPGSEVFRVNQSGSSPSSPPSGYSSYPTFGADKLSITIPSGDFDYIGLHWGGKGGGVYQAFYIGNIGGAAPSTYTFNAPDKNGLSWYDTFHTVQHKVPDFGSTAALMGLAMLGLMRFRAVLKTA